ncbi:MAG: hypothetical protein WBD01_05185 [Salaquimonas sp.]
MFRVQKRPNHKSTWSIAKLSMITLLSLGFFASPFNLGVVDAGNSGNSMRKMSSHKVSQSGGGNRTMRQSNLRSKTYQRSVVSKGVKRDGFRNHRSNIKQVSRNESGNRTYTKRRSVLDGGKMAGSSNSVRVSSRQLYTRPVRGQSIRHYGSSNQRGERIVSSRVMSTRSHGDVGGNAQLRSGVKYINRGHSNSYGGKTGFRELAGSTRTKIIKRELNGNNQSGSTKVATGYSDQGLIIIGVATASGMQEIAGNQMGQSNADCQYGTYCTIDLGGPKIITFNDTGDIQDGELTEDLTEEEYLQKYGSK